MVNKELQQLRERFILPVKEEDIKQRIKNCLDQDVKIIRNDGEVNVFFGRKLSPKKTEYWKEYALSTYKLIDSPKP